MADISKEIDDIKSAVYGEEVRQSIIDALVKLNNSSAFDGAFVSYADEQNLTADEQRRARNNINADFFVAQTGTPIDLDTVVDEGLYQLYGDYTYTKAGQIITQNFKGPMQVIKNGTWTIQKIMDFQSATQYYEHVRRKTNAGNWSNLITVNFTALSSLASVAALNEEEVI